MLLIRVPVTIHSFRHNYSYNIAHHFHKKLSSLNLHRISLHLNMHDSPNLSYAANLAVIAMEVVSV